MGAGEVDDFAGGDDAGVEFGVEALVFAQGTQQLVAHEGAQEAEIPAGGEAGSGVLADLLAGVVAAAVVGEEGVVEFFEAVGVDGVIFEGGGVIGEALADEADDGGEAGAGEVVEVAFAVIGFGLEGGVLDFGGVGEEVTGEFGGVGGERKAGSFLVLGDALGFAGTGDEVGGDALDGRADAVDDVLEGLVFDVGGGVEGEGLVEVGVGFVAVLLFFSEHGGGVEG